MNRTIETMSGLNKSETIIFNKILFPVLDRNYTLKDVFADIKASNNIDYLIEKGHIRFKVDDKESGLKFNTLVFKPDLWRFIHSD
jgi:hypothetical protein